MRNWDYRYTWIRDAAFTLYALLRLGFTEEAEAFMRFLQDRALEADSHERRRRSRSCTASTGARDLDECVLDHWEGYRGSRPVRIGNGAAEQLQLDIFGELIDSVYLYDKFGAPISLRPVEGRAAACWSGSATTGRRRTRASGRCAAASRSSRSRG